MSKHQLTAIAAGLCCLFVYPRDAEAQTSPAQTNTPVRGYLNLAAAWSLGSNGSYETVPTVASSSSPSAPPICYAGGPFCGQVSTSVFAATVSAGMFVGRHAAIEAEWSPQADGTGDGTYFEQGKDRVRTTGALTHAQSSVSALVRLRPDHRRSIAIEPVFGVTVTNITETMTGRVMSITPYASTTTYTYPKSDISTSQSAVGLTLGLDFVVASDSAVSFIVTTRGRWLGIRYVGGTSTSTGDTLPVLVSSGLLTVGAGIRWGGRR